MKNPFERVDTCCGFTSNLAEVCYSGPSDVCYSAPISAGRVTLSETKWCHISTASTSTICLCLSLHVICVLIVFLHPFAFLPPETLKHNAKLFLLFSISSFICSCV